MTPKGSFLSTGVAAALGAAALFGLSMPLAKMLLGSVEPALLAGLLYLGSGFGLTILRGVRSSARASLARKDRLYLLGAIVSGGIIAPLLLMQGLASMPAAGASLLLNAEGVFTALLAWFVFRENFDRRIAFGMFIIAAGATIISWSPAASLDDVRPALLVLGACLAWAIDNNLTGRISLLDASWLASIKGLVAGTVNLAIAVMLGARWPGIAAVSGALIVGSLGYGASLVLFVIGLRHLGTARTTAYFSIAPFFGAVAAVIALREPLTTSLVVAFPLMALGVWLHLTERHEHWHHHAAMEHDHEHVHDEHHLHSHDPEVPAGARHRHAHSHEPTAHAHPHFPDAHHHHEHGPKKR
jgi:drug/metabolite transporter (DMT)-like permease